MFTLYHLFYFQSVLIRLFSITPLQNPVLYVSIKVHLISLNISFESFMDVG